MILTWLGVAIVNKKTRCEVSNGFRLMITMCVIQENNVM